MAEQNTPRRRQSRQQQPVDNTYAHLQPQALDVERAVLGALLVDKDAYSVVCEILKPESFYEPRNRIIYEAIQHLSMNEQPSMRTVASFISNAPPYILASCQ